ncbi:uncharacterized protein LOC130630588 isoform X2 [Hydractinia symbiolongicarpus]|uniref:uncharacterized protein LOC130630588 isoform X2 n=1 Tax=Hydractinia symbiolongicarpus TaxID=13093 RepID=UPI00254DC6B8|nr:uncharacterized protein LOC130630588 isoform X2 [Hydractinia symbiolongicarpus]
MAMLMYKIRNVNYQEVTVIINIFPIALSDLINYHSSELHTELPRILVRSHNNICKAIELLLQNISYPENIWYNGGGGKRVEISYKEWLEDICLDYAREYFGHPKESALKEVLLFPPYYIVNDKFSQILNWATYFLKQEYGVGAVIWQYDLIEYFHFLQLQDSLDFDRIGCCQNRILVICPTPLTIFNIRYTDACDINSVVHELKRGEQDITYFCIAHKDSLLSTQITLINTVAAPNFSDNNLICRECSVANKEMLTTADSFAHFLKEQITSENTEDVEKDETVLKIVGFITAFMAMKETFTYNHAICRVPTLSKEVTEQVKSMLMLNPSQLKVINSKKSKKIVLGNFGSGKSLVGVYQLQYLMLSARKETLIYFIAWSEKSVLVHHIKRLIANFFQMDSLDMKEGNFKMKKASSYVTQINDLMVQFGLQKLPSLSYLLSILFERHCGKQVHVVIDEYDGEVLDREEAEKINHFCQREEVKKSCILIIPHSLEKHRTYVKSGKTLPHDKYQYKYTGMEIFRLKKVLRTTKRIHEVVKTFQEKLCHTKKVFKHQLSEEDVSPNTDETQSIFVENELDQFSAHKLHECDLKDNSNVKTSLSKEEKEEQGHERQKGKEKGRDVAGDERERKRAKEEGVKEGEEEEKEEEEGKVRGKGGGEKIDEGKKENARAREDGKGREEEPITSGITQSCFTKTKMHKSVDFDYLANSIDEVDCSDDVRTETSFSYPYCHLIGHKIEGETPKFIAYIRWPDSDAEKITQMAVALKKYLLDESNKLVLAQTDHNRYLFEKAFDLIKLDYYTCCCSTDWQVRDKKGEMVSIMSEPYTLITNYEGCRGLEAEEVVVCIDGVHDLNQVFIEHCSRSTGRLLIMCQQPFDLKHAVHSTMCDTMMMLFKKNMIHLIIVETKMDENTTRNCHSKLEEWSDETWVEIDERKNDSLCREVVQINTSEDTAYRRYLDEADEFEKYVGREEIMINLKSLIRKRLEPPFPAKDLKAYYTSDETCTLSWRNDHFEYTVQIAESKNSKHPKWRDIATAISYSELVVKGIQNDTTYNFRVLSTSSFGSVASNIVTYHSRYRESQCNLRITTI